ncbi:MAG: sulfotransferase [Bacteroidia bacterium]|nr:sulfotransferase [Bacteroidia bacterium]
MNSSVVEYIPIKKKASLFGEFSLDAYPNFNPIVDKPKNLEKVTLEQIDNLQIAFIATTGRSASTLLGIMLMMSEQVIFTSEEIFPIILKQKYGKIRRWTEQDVKNYCDDFVLMSEGKLYPLFCGKSILYELLIKFKEHLNYERVIRISYLSFGVGKDLSKITTIVDKQLRYYLFHRYLSLFPNSKVLLLVRDPRDNVYSKYHRAIRKAIELKPCLYIYTWKFAFEKYLKLLQQYKCDYLIVNYERLINDSQKIMQDISAFISVPYTEKYFEYPTIIRYFFESIKHPKLKEHFMITHKSLTQPISPQKVNEWKNYMNDKTITHLVNITWTGTQSIAERLKYQKHSDFQPTFAGCLKIILKIKISVIFSYLYFNLFPFCLKKIIKTKKYPYRRNSETAYDKFLKQGYL